MQTTTYSIADQLVRYNTALHQSHTRYLHIDSVYDGSYLQGKRVLLTGANRGLGLALATELHKQRAHVIAFVRESSDALDALGCDVITGVDVTNEAAVRDAVATGVREPVDYVLHNAGYFPDVHDSLADGMRYDEQLRQIDVCALGPLRVVEALHSQSLIGGCVAVITSQAGSLAWRTTQNAARGGDYGHHMSRAACNMGVVLLAEELRHAAVPVLLLHPGFNRTDMTAKYRDIWDAEGAVEPAVGAKRVLHEMSAVTMERTGTFVNCEDGLRIPW